MLLKINYRQGVPVIDSRIVAHRLGFLHRQWLRRKLDSYQETIEHHFGKLNFEEEHSGAGGQPVKYALLTQEQAEFFTLLSRNNRRVVEFKAELIKAFSKARSLSKSIQINKQEWFVPSISFSKVQAMRNNYGAAKGAADGAYFYSLMGRTKAAQESHDMALDFFTMGNIYFEEIKEDLSSSIHSIDF